MFDLIIKNGTCVTPNGREQCDIGVSNGKIVALGTLNSQQAKNSLDAKNLHVLPGVIDTQVHLREPGNEHKEDLDTGTKAAILGGVTAVFEMPNTNPSTTTAALLQDKIDRASGRAWCDFAFFMGGTDDPTSRWEELEALPGCAGIKIFMGSSTGSLLVSDDQALLNILRHSRRRIAVHCEDEQRLKERVQIAQEAGHPRAHPIWRDAESAYLATSRLLKLARETNHRVHVLHVTTAEEMALLAAYKDIATVEVTPQHLTLTDEIYERIGTLGQMNPPIREKKHQEALWRAVNNGLVDIIGSDHAPHTLEEKSQAYPKSPSGMPGVQTLVPLMLNHINEGRLTLERFVDLTAAGPARVYQIANKGRIALGYDADFTLVDLNATRTINNSWIASRCGWTPFDGMTVRGWMTHTVIHGHIVMQEDTVIGTPVGQPVVFL